MANEIVKKPNNLEELLSGEQVVSLGRSLRLNDTQIAKANKAILDMQNDPKLEGTKTMAQVRFAYNVATLNYKNPNAVAPVKYGEGIQAQLQYQAIIEDMQECGGLKDNKVLFGCLYEGVDYQPTMVGDFVVLTFPKATPVKDIFNKPKVVGFYCQVETKDYGVISSVMSIEQVKEWATRYSISYRSGKHSPYTTNFNDMGIKTCIKAVGRAVLKRYPFDRLAKALDTDFVVFDEEGSSYKDNPQQEEEQPIEKGGIRNKIEMPKPDPEKVVEEQQATTMVWRNTTLLDFINTFLNCHINISYHSNHTIAHKH